MTSTIIQSCRAILLARIRRVSPSRLRKMVIIVCAIYLLVWTLTLPNNAARIPIPGGAMKSQLDSPGPQTPVIDKPIDLHHHTIQHLEIQVEAVSTPTLNPVRAASTSAHRKKLPAPSQLVAQPMDTPDIQKMDQLDPLLWEHIKSNHVIPPSKLPYHFPYGIPTNKSLDFIDKPVDEILQSIFLNMTNGIFVEVGAFDGWWSHTLWYEVYFNWTGLLIECHPTLVPTVKSINRKAYLADVCLSQGSHPEKGLLTSLDKHPGSASMGFDRGATFPGMKSNFTIYEVQTVPLYAIMAAVSIRHVDLFILDVQLLEVPVLKNFPFDLVHVNVWVIEITFLDKIQQVELRRFMEGKGYSKDRYWERSFDAIFIHESFQARSSTPSLKSAS